MERLNFTQYPNTAISAQNFDSYMIGKSRVDTLNALEGEYTGYHCVKCKNKGFVAILREDGSFFTRECSCMPARRSLRQMESSGLSKTIKSQTFQSFQATQPWQVSLKEKVEEYAKAPTGWLMLGGQPGSGKTHLCTAVCRELLLRGEAVFYMPWREYIGKLKAINGDANERFALLDKCKKSPWLYIDDLFKTGKNPDQQTIPTSTDINIAFEIINHRYCQQLPTIISTEKSSEELTEIDEALASRIIECCQNNLYCITPDTKKNYRMRNVTCF